MMAARQNCRVTCRIVTAALLALCAARPAAADWQKQLMSKRLLFTFQGKGSSLPYDAGVVQRAFECIPAVRENRVIVAGNSSGSIFAVYFSVFGFTETSVRYAEYRILRADTSAVRANENVPRKALGLLRNQPTEIPHLALKEYIAFALGVQDYQDARSIGEIARRSGVVPGLPLVIVAANKEVLDNRGEGNALAARNHKEFNPDDFSVSWKPEVFEFYRSRPDRFKKDYPDLRLGDDPYIGKACTCFVDQSMFNLLSRIPDEERLCDLRLVTDAADMALAIQASVAEPSYFPAVAETDYKKLYIDGRFNTAGRARRRSYVGGFIMPLVAQDVRRMLPEIRVLGTGVARVPILGRQLVQSWYLVDLQPAADLHAWWTDLEVSIPRSVQQEMIQRVLSKEQEFQRGYQRASECFSLDRGLPKYVSVPAYTAPAAGALVSDGGSIDLVNTPAGGGNRAASSPAPRLRTMRGLGPLLEGGE